MKYFTITAVTEYEIPIPYRMLDMDVERGAATEHKPHRPFTERVLDEVNELPDSEKDHQFLVACSLYGNIYITANPNNILRFSLAGNVYNSRIRRMTLCDAMTVVYRDGEKFRPLPNWELRHFKRNDTPDFLNKEKLETEMKKIFHSVTITLGELTHLKHEISCPAWQITTEKGTYFLPWHSGAIIEGTNEFSFEEKNFSQLKETTYTHLRFAVANSFMPPYPKMRSANQEIYYIRSC